MSLCEVLHVQFSQLLFQALCRRYEKNEHKLVQLSQRIFQLQLEQQLWDHTNANDEMTTLKYRGERVLVRQSQPPVPDAHTQQPSLVQPQ